MLQRVLGRLLASAVLVWLVATVTFAVVQAVPGSFADTLDEPRLPAQAREAIRARFGLDQPLPAQYARWLRDLARGDLGVSFVAREPVARVIGRALPPTLILTGAALALDLLLGLGLALAAVRRPHGWVDRTLTVLGLGVYGLPSFWLAGLAILLFSLVLGWLPPSHMHSVDADQLGGVGRLLDLLRHLLLPAACMALAGAAATARYLRASLLDLAAAPFLLAARARGLSPRRLLLAHALRPALAPVVTLVGLSLPVLVSGAVAIEVVFAWPGMGRVMWEAAIARDVPVIMAATLLGSVGVILGNLVADVAYALVDPRARGPR